MQVVFDTVKKISPPNTYMYYIWGQHVDIILRVQLTSTEITQFCKLKQFLQSVSAISNSLYGSELQHLL